MNVSRVINPVLMQMLNSVSVTGIIISLNVLDQPFLTRNCSIVRRNWVRRVSSIFTYGKVPLALINDNQLFRIWTENRLMPYIGYFTVPLTSRNTGKVFFFSFRNFMDESARQWNDHLSSTLQSESNDCLVSRDCHHVREREIQNTIRSINSFLEMIDWVISE